MANETESENERSRPSSVAFDLARPALDALTRTTEWYGKTALTWQNEMMRFATERLVARPSCSKIGLFRC